jgi:hypothetical protein
MNKEKINKMFSILVFVILICMSIAFLFTYDHADSLQSEIEKRDLIIERLNKNDSINQAIIENSNQLIENKNEFSSGELVKYANEMSNAIDSLYNKLLDRQNQINSINDTLRYYKIYFDLSQKKFNHKYIVSKNAGGGRNYIFEQNAVVISEYKKSQDEINNLQKEVFNLKNSLKLYKSACEKYDIKIEGTTSSKNGYNYTSYDIYSPKLDSALMLLPVYGPKLKFDSKNKIWSVGGKMYIRYITVEKDSIK